MKKIVFFVQTRKPIGGSQVLFLDFASYISNNYPEYEVYYINFRNPKVEQLYGNSNIKFYDVLSCDYSQFEDAVFFTPVNYVLYLAEKTKNLKNAKVLYYFYHPQIVEWLNMQIYKKKPDFKTIFELLSSHNACCFMDSSNLISAKKIGVDFSETYVPVTLHGDIPAYEPKKIVSNEEINVGWLGRLDHDKIHSVINLADNLAGLDSPKKINIHLVGDGNAKHLIKLSKYSPQIRFVFTSYLYGEERDEYLKTNADFVVAMGISAIDTALLGIPTLVPLVSGEPFREDSFYYLFNTTGYSLGWNAFDAEAMNCKAHTIEQVVSDIYEKNLKQELGEKCRNFAISEFSLENGTKLLLEALEKTTLTVKECNSSSLVASMMRFYRLYRSYRKNCDFERFHEFNARLKRLNLTKGIINKSKRLFKELNRTFIRKEAKK